MDLDSTGRRRTFFDLCSSVPAGACCHVICWFHAQTPFRSAPFFAQLFRLINYIIPQAAESRVNLPRNCRRSPTIGGDTLWEQVAAGWLANRIVSPTHMFGMLSPRVLASTLLGNPSPLEMMSDHFATEGRQGRFGLHLFEQILAGWGSCTRLGVSCRLLREAYEGLFCQIRSFSFTALLETLSFQERNGIIHSSR